MLTGTETRGERTRRRAVRTARNAGSPAWILAAVELAELLPLGALEQQMKRTGGPGIIPFELAGSSERARRMMDTWGSEGRSAARLSLLLDYPFPATYAPLHGLACTATAAGFVGRDRRTLAGAGGPLAWAQLAAAGFDYVENTTLLLILSGRLGALPALARRAALTKFVLISAGWGYILLGLGDAAWKRSRP